MYRLAELTLKSGTIMTRGEEDRSDIESGRIASIPLILPYLAE